MSNPYSLRAAAWLLSLVLFIGAAGLWSKPAHAANNDPTDTSTQEIFQTTISGIPSCLRWRVKGICVWLVCRLYECSVEETIRVEHYTPDTTMSTWHDPDTHPWRDYGRKIAQKLAGAGKSLASSFGGPAVASVAKMDSAGTKTKADRDTTNYIYRGVDVIGNPANFVTGAITGDYGGGDSPTSVTIPTPIELIYFLQSFPQQVAAQWRSIPSSYTSGQTDFAQGQMNQWSGAMGLSSSNIGRVVNRVSGAYQQVTSTYTTNGRVDGLESSRYGGTDGAGNRTGNGQNGPKIANGSDYFCPPGITPFGLAFQSDLDTPFWRGFLPLESIFPAPWLPGMREVGQGIFQTWGSVWPRQGSLFQQHPVKAAAVIAQRAGDIISHRAQPHIYAPLQLDTNYSYQFIGFQGIREHDENHTIWQRVFPNPQNTCSIFGQNDSTSIMGFGDGQNVNARGTVWNAWRKQDCCKRPTSGVPIFLFAIP